jgi:hypothetical protein
MEILLPDERNGGEICIALLMPAGTRVAEYSADFAWILVRREGEELR